ncbi:MAG: hypothetical protein LKI53_01935 [Bacteroidales bacterium]|jgi:Skp family chaperone for outer membrane proteins|nr:hypothetical protein [Bacteroidales bacterium]
MKKILFILCAVTLSLCTSTAFAQSNAEKIAEEKASRLQKKFNLTDKQKEEARKIFLNETITLQNARENMEKAKIKMDSVFHIKMKQGEKAMDSLKSKTGTALESILTEEQLKKYKDFFKRFKHGTDTTYKEMPPSTKDSIANPSN